MCWPDHLPPAKSIKPANPPKRRSRRLPSKTEKSMWRKPAIWPLDIRSWNKSVRGRLEMTSVAADWVSSAPFARVGSMLGFRSTASASKRKRPRHQQESKARGFGNYNGNAHLVRGCRNFNELKVIHQPGKIR